MARKPSSSSRNTAANRRSQGAGSGKPGTRKGRNPRAQKAADAERDSRKLIDEYAKRDIVGIAFTVAAVVLFIAAVMRSDAIVTSFISSALHLTLGIGAYILPLFLLAIGIPTSAPRSPKASLLRVPPILCIRYQDPMSGYSKALRGLSVQSRVMCIFTHTSISPGLLLRQLTSRYAIRAGRNLPDKEFRYLRTVIVTAAVYWGFGSLLRVSPNTSP